jgi:hypothetical protein
MNTKLHNKNGVKMLVLAVVLGALAACHTTGFRRVQSNFNSAMQQDNAGASAEAKKGFADLSQELTPDYIAKLDPKLRPNAWMIRAVSAWRVGLTNDVAQESVDRGLSDTNLVVGSRDQIMMTMVPALVVDSDLLGRWQAANKNVGDVYSSVFEKGFKAALTELSKIPPLMNERTPPDTRAYYHYQRWRILQNWASVIGSLTPPEVASDANQRAKAFVGKGLLDAAKEDRDKIPNNDPLRALIRAQGGG